MENPKYRPEDPIYVSADPETSNELKKSIKEELEKLIEDLSNRITFVSLEELADDIRLIQEWEDGSIRRKSEKIIEEEGSIGTNQINKVENEYNHLLKKYDSEQMEEIRRIIDKRKQISEE